jgi:predicted helicase
VLREHFGQGLTDEGVHILDGFTGTGTFITRLLQSGLIEPHDLARKYAHELHANEILLLAYYIAAVNIETTYQDLVRGSS